MFGMKDLFALAVSVFIILPVVTFIRESGYFLISGLFGVKNPRLTVGSGPRLFTFWILDVRKYYHIYSWFSFDSIKNKSKFAYILIYAGPILINAVVALVINALLANDFFDETKTFWNRFIFYAFYYVMFDAVPMITLNGKPNNGMVIYELLRYGKRVDYNEDPLIPETSEAEEEYQEEMRKIEQKVEEKVEEKESRKK